MAGWTQCVIEQRCFFNDYKGGQTKKKYCRILTGKDGKPPYIDKCPFFKKDANDYSGGREAYEECRELCDVGVGGVERDEGPGDVSV